MHEELIIRDAVLDDAAQLVALLNPIIEAGTFSALDTVLTEDDERLYIAGLAERAFLHVAVRPGDLRRHVPRLVRDAVRRFFRRHPETARHSVQLQSLPQRKCCRRDSQATTGGGTRAPFDRRKAETRQVVVELEGAKMLVRKKPPDVRR